jgi:hypothetical protein
MEPIHFNIENFDKNILIIYKSAFKSILGKIVKLGAIRFRSVEIPELNKLEIED